MSIVIGCEKVSVEFPTKRVFDNLSLGVNTGDRIGIVGQNGCGKSTLIDVLAKRTEIDAGRVVHTHGIEVGVLAQRDSLRDTDTVLKAVLGDTPEYEWASNARIRNTLDALLCGIDRDAQVNTLSGGQRRRVDLARLLIGTYDVLMLDEPTNHLDVSTISWLAEHLKTRWRKNVGALLVVTHDRWFLDEVATAMWEVRAGGVEAFEGGFSAYIMQRVERERLAAATEQKRQNKLRRELAWLSRGARARATKPKFHVKAAQQLIEDVPPLRDTLELKRMAMSRLGKQVVDLDSVCVEYEEAGAADAAEAQVGTTGSSDNESGAGSAPTCTKRVLDHITWMIGPGDRFGILGENGAGKTTLLNVVQGIQKPTSGRVKIGKTVKFAVLSQHLDALHKHDTSRVRDVIGQYSHRIMLDGKETTPAQLVENLGFTRADLNEVVGSLSGGQARRLSLMLILLDEPNVLILDEPGNDLDVDMLAEMESMLDMWPGTLLLVTHDRYLMERVCDHQFALIDGALRHLPGGVEEYVRIMNGQAEGGAGDRKHHGGAASNAGSSAGSGANASSVNKNAGGSANKGANAGGSANENTSDTASTGPPAQKLTGAQIHKMRKNITSLEGKIETAKRKLSEKQAELNSANPTDYVLLSALQQEVDDAQARIDALETEWLETAEALEAQGA